MRESDARRRRATSRIRILCSRGLDGLRAFERRVLPTFSEVPRIAGLNRCSAGRYPHTHEPLNRVHESDGPEALTLGVVVAGGAECMSNAKHYSTALHKGVRMGLSWEDVDPIELNAAFAQHVLAVFRGCGWSENDSRLERLNVNESSISLPHPVGVAGVPLVAALLDGMRRREAHYGSETMCSGGQVLAAIFGW